MADRVAPGRERPRALLLGPAVGLLFISIGAFLSSGALSDNSFFTHLATGRLIVESGSVPTTDPYTWTAAGEPWVVQSWLVSVLYGQLDSWFGLAGPRMLHVVLGAVLAGILWLLTDRQPSVFARIAVVFLAVAALGTFVVERPLMVGLVCFGILQLVLDRRRGLSVWLVVPLMWIWVNSHGSFPLAGVLVVLVAAGRLLDGRDIDREWRVLAAVVLGILAGAVLSPLGLSALWFPVELVGRSGALAAVIEWRSPDFSGWGLRPSLLVAAGVVLAGCRDGAFRRSLPAAVLLVAGLVAVRNVPVAVLVAVPLLAAGAPAVGSLRAGERGPVPGVAVVLAALIAVGAIANVAVGDHLDLAAYPVALVERLEADGELGPGATARVAYPDRIGNLLAFRHGAQQNLFFDDRFDIYEVVFLEEMVDLMAGRRVIDTLDRYGVDIALWPATSALAGVLEASPNWLSEAEADDWVVLRRR